MRGIIYPESRKVACVLLQAVYGANSSVAHYFDTALWELSPPQEAPKGFDLTPEKWREVARKFSEHHKLKEAK